MQHENFFIDDTFYHDMDGLQYDLDLYDEDQIRALPDDWCIVADAAELEKVYTVKERDISGFIEHMGEQNEERFPEDPESVDEKIKAAFLQAIDLDKLNSLLPSLYYPNGKTITITKADLLESL